jgi:hypothetical protein
MMQAIGLGNHPSVNFGELMSIPVAAQRLGGISAWTLRAWINQGRIKKTKVGARTMVTASALQQFLDDCALQGQQRYGKGDI